MPQNADGEHHITKQHAEVRAYSLRLIRLCFAGFGSYRGAEPEGEPARAVEAEISGPNWDRPGTQRRSYINNAPLQATGCEHSVARQDLSQIGFRGKGSEITGGSKGAISSSKIRLF